MNIFIVSAGRPTRQITYQSIKHLWDYHEITLVVPEKDRQAYMRSNPDVGSWLFHDKFGIKDTRQYVLEGAQESWEKKFVMLDDDLTFYARQEDSSFKKADEDSISDMFYEIEAQLSIYTHGSVVDKFMSHTRPRGLINNGRYNQVMCYNLDLFPNPIPEFRIGVVEDQDYNLQLLSKGKASFILTEFAKSSKPYAAGGCSEWRTPEVELAAHKALVDQWPGIVSLRSNNTTISKTSLSIKWKKAYNASNPNIYPVEVTGVSTPERYSIKTSKEF